MDFDRTYTNIYIPASSANAPHYIKYIEKLKYRHETKGTP